MIQRLRKILLNLIKFKYIKYKNDFQFVNDFAFRLSKEMDLVYHIEKFKHIENEEVDLYIKNIANNSSYCVVIKGHPKDLFLPPEILPAILKTKNKFASHQNYFILISLAPVSDNVKTLFEKNDILIFEYSKHKYNLCDDFIEFINNVDINKKHIS
jgi:hypothetical protein